MAAKVSQTVLELQKIRQSLRALTTEMQGLSAEVRGLTEAVREVLAVVREHGTRLDRLEHPSR